MKHYVEQHLTKDEKIVLLGERNPLGLMGTWLKFGIKFIIWLIACVGLSFAQAIAEYTMQINISYSASIPEFEFDLGEHILDAMLPTSMSSGAVFLIFFFIPLCSAVFATISFYKTEVGITTRRVVGKYGVFNTTTVDTSLEKVESCEVHQPFFGKLFNYSTINIKMGENTIPFKFLKNAEGFKSEITNSLEELQKARAKAQAEMQAAEMARVMAAMNQKHD